MSALPSSDPSTPPASAWTSSAATSTNNHNNKETPDGDQDFKMLDDHLTALAWAMIPATGSPWLDTADDACAEHYRE